MSKLELQRLGDGASDGMLKQTSNGSVYNLADRRISWHQATTHHLADLALIAAGDKNSTWTLSAIEQSMQAGCQVEWVCIDGQVAGFYVLDERAKVEAELHYMIVAGPWRRLGVGRQMLRRVIESLSDPGTRVFFLEVRCSNNAAIALYLQMGFYKIGSRVGYYRSSTGREDADQMRLDVC